MGAQHEALLIAQAKQYEPEAVSMIYQRYADRIFRYIFYRVGEQALAEDLLSDVFVRALEALPRYSDEGRPFEAWLYRIAHARVVDHYRRQNVRRTTELNPFMRADEGDDPDQTVDRQEDARQVRSALLSLSEDQQQVIALRFAGNYSVAEIAALLAKTEGAVRSLQHRALAALRRLLEQEREPF
jgi:RNA polymerase sigma-70 factor, ECF subfamily